MEALNQLLRLVGTYFSEVFIPSKCLHTSSGRNGEDRKEPRSRGAGFKVIFGHPPSIGPMPEDVTVFVLSPTISLARLVASIQALVATSIQNGTDAN